MDSSNNIKLFLAKQEIDFKNLDIYIIAFTHTSYVHEANDKNLESYERLEFLGDSVLGKEIAEYLYKNFEDKNPGELSLLRSKIVNKESLSKIGKSFEFEKLIFFGKGEVGKTPSDSVYEDVFESFIGALYLDQGPEKTKEYIVNLFKGIISNMDLNDLNDLKDYKTQLQEKLQAEKRETVKYKTIEKIKENNTQLFHIQAILENEIILGSGKAESKRKAEQIAAKDALSKLTKIKLDDIEKEV